MRRLLPLLVIGLLHNRAAALVHGSAIRKHVSCTGASHICRSARCTIDQDRRVLRPQSRNGLIRSSLNASSRYDAPDSSGGGGGADRLRAVTYTAIWTALVAYAFLYAPGHTPEGDAAVTQMTAALMTNPFSPDINQLYVVIFNALGVVPAIYAQLLLPGSKGQRLPAAPFVLASFAGGYFLLAPYLALRQYRPCVDEAQLRGLATLSTLRLGGVLTLVFALGLLQFAITNHVWTSFEEYMLLFRSQTLVHVSSIDLLLLSVVVWEPMLEDMRRRGMYTDGSRSANIRLAAFCAIPVLGPAVYLAVRPPLLAAED